MRLPSPTSRKCLQPHQVPLPPPTSWEAADLSRLLPLQFLVGYVVDSLVCELGVVSCDKNVDCESVGFDHGRPRVGSLHVCLLLNAVGAASTACHSHTGQHATASTTPSEPSAGGAGGVNVYGMHSIIHGVVFLDAGWLPVCTCCRPTMQAARGGYGRRSYFVCGCGQQVCAVGVCSPGAAAAVCATHVRRHSECVLVQPACGDAPAGLWLPRVMGMGGRITPDTPGAWLRAVQHVVAMHPCRHVAMAGIRLCLGRQSWQLCQAMHLVNGLIGRYPLHDKVLSEGLMLRRLYQVAWCMAAPPMCVPGIACTSLQAMHCRRWQQSWIPLLKAALHVKGVHSGQQLGWVVHCHSPTHAAPLVSGRWGSADCECRPVHSLPAAKQPCLFPAGP